MARARRDDASELFREYVAECLKALAGAKSSYSDLKRPQPDFDMDAVISHVIESF